MKGENDFFFRRKSIKKGQMKFYLFEFQLIIYLFLIIFQFEKVNSDNQITLIIEGNENQQLINNNFYKVPSQVIVNDEFKSSCQKSCELGEGRNTIILKFDEQLSTCAQMFQNLNHIKEIYLSDFDGSKVRFMEKMFEGCSGLELIDFSNFDTSNIENMNALFNGCSGLKSLNISNFNTSKVNNMEYMFSGCSNLENINFGNIDTSLVYNMGLLFNGCAKLTIIDLSNWVFSNVIYMVSMFKSCSNLIKVDFGNIDTPSLQDMATMFQYCINLTSIDLSKFDFSNVNNMYGIFNNCKKLVKINFGNINTSNLVNMGIMFQECNSLTSIDLSKFDFSKVKHMEFMFNGCFQLENITFGKMSNPSLESVEGLFKRTYNLKSIDLSNLDFSKVKNMQYMFEDCSNLESIIFGNISTSSLENMANFFKGCSSLKSIDLSNLNFSKVNDLSHLFHGCSSLESIDLSNLNTSSVTTMDTMFYLCYNLKSINFGNIDTSSVENMHALFQECKSLESLNLSNFDTSKVTTMQAMFFNCKNIKFLNLSNFNTSKIQLLDHMFSLSENLKYLNLYSFQIVSTAKWEEIFLNLPETVVYCIHDNATKNHLLDGDKISFCSDECYNTNNTKIDVGNQICLDSCLNSVNNYYEYNNICYNKCPKGTLVFDYLCLKNNCDELEKYSIECSDGKPIGYYLDPIDEIYKKCFTNCKFCYGEGNEANNNCIECKAGFKLLNDFENDTNCYPECEFYYYFDELKIYHCTENRICPDEYKLLIPEKNRCIDQCEKDNIYIYKYHETCINISISETSYFDNVINETNYNINNIEEEYTDIIIYECLHYNSYINICFLQGIYDNNEKHHILRNKVISKYSADNNKSLVFEGEDDVIYQITSVKNEMELLNDNNITDNYNISIIDLSNCEALLKEENNIEEKDSLIILKKEKLKSKTTEKDIEYECFEPYNKTKLNMSICSKLNFNLFIKYELSEETKQLSEQLKNLGYNMFDINDKFYQDVCTPYKSWLNTDLLLSDRIEYIYNNKDAQCQENCEFSNYILDTNYINCSCSTQREEEDIQIKKFDELDAKTVYQSFYYVLKYSNYKIVQCYKLVFAKSVLSKNIGSILILILVLLYLICLILYIIKGMNPIKSKLRFILDEKGKLNSRKSILFFPPKKRKSSYTLKHPKDSTVSELKLNKEDKSRSGMEVKRASFKSKTDKIHKENEKSNIKIFSSKNVVDSTQNPYKIRKSLLKSIEQQKKLKEAENQKKKLDDFELNELSYEEALELDRRNCFQIYISLLKREHRIIFTFLICKDFNLKSIKFSRFIFLVATDVAMNVLFFSDVTMHKIFLDYGKYDFIQQIPQIIYSTIVSQLLEVFLCFLSLTDKNMYQIKSLNLNSEEKKLVLEIFNCIKIKLICYFLFTFILFSFYWYLVAVFCAVYENTQIAFIKDSFISIFLNLIYPFILYIFPSAFRVCAIRTKSNWLFKFSDVIPFF